MTYFPGAISFQRSSPSLFFIILKIMRIQIECISTIVAVIVPQKRHEIPSNWTDKLNLEDGEVKNTLCGHQISAKSSWKWCKKTRYFWRQFITLQHVQTWIEPGIYLFPTIVHIILEESDDRHTLVQMNLQHLWMLKV